MATQWTRLVYNKKYIIFISNACNKSEYGVTHSILIFFTGDANMVAK